MQDLTPSAASGLIAEGCMVKAKTEVIYAVPPNLKSAASTIEPVVDDFLTSCEPLESRNIYILVDAKTNALYSECHVRATKIVELSTIDVPLDPEDQPEYRANREIVEDHVAYQTMKEDARLRRTFSNIVAEYTSSFDPSHPLKIIGGQHRFTAIKEALAAGINEYHGLKIYFGLNAEQRLDVQLISNTNIAASSDLFDRMHETLAGPELRNWCQEVGLLEAGEDFADRRLRGLQITVKAARTFIINYFAGVSIELHKFDQTNTIPVVCKTGVPDPDWDKLRLDNPKLWLDPKLKRAGKEFALLVQAQRAAFSGAKAGAAVNIDYAEKASNFAVLSAWAYVSGVLAPNSTRLDRHYGLKNQKSRDPLNAAVLAKARHKTDSENYRGLGYRTDAKERGRFVELFYLQAEKGGGIDKGTIDIAIKGSSGFSVGENSGIEGAFTHREGLLCATPSCTDTCWACWNPGPWSASR